MLPTTIKVSYETKKRLDDIAIRRETYDSVINRLLDMMYPVKETAQKSKSAFDEVIKV